MKKIITISIVTSAMLFGATVDNLTNDQVNLTTNSTINNALADQGTTKITGNADVDNLTIIQKSDDGTPGNYIDNLTVNGLILIILIFIKVVLQLKMQLLMV